VYQWLTAYFLHQDRVSWSRIQTIVAVEAGILAAAFALDCRASLVPLVVGTFLIGCVWRLVRRDWQIRDQDLAKLDLVHKPRGIRITKRAANVLWSGAGMLKLLMWSLGLINLALALLFLHFKGKSFLEW